VTARARGAGHGRSLARAVYAWRALLALGAALAGGGCLIEERPFDEQGVSCSAYCEAIQSKCVGDDAVYRNEDECRAVCEQIPLGHVGDEPGNTVQCRLDLLQAGDFEVGPGCPAAGPGGNGVCGSNCESFCSLRERACGAIDPNDPDVSRPGFCEASCPGLADSGTFSLATAASTDTLQCRLTHLSRALGTSAGALGAPGVVLDACIQSQIIPENEESVCTDSLDISPEADCATYCGLVMTSCKGGFAVYANATECKAACKTFERGQHGDTGVNTLRCRRYHAYAALDGPEEHCAHAGPTGDGHCASPPEAGPGNCVSYCRILRAACPSQYQSRFDPVDADDLGGCIGSCAALPDAGRDGFTIEPRYTTAAPPASGLKCQTYYAVEALEKPDSALECLAAFGDEGSPCGGTTALR
jgi:hypothetical protein